MSYKRLLELEAYLRHEVDELFTLAEQADQGRLPEGMNVTDEITIRKERWRVGRSQSDSGSRAQERYAAEQAEYEAKLREREAKAERSKRKPRGRPPEPPTSGPRDSDQYNFTDPDSRIMKCSNSGGFEQSYNAQVAVDQGKMLIVAHALSNHPNDKAEAQPTLAALPPALGTPDAVAMDNGYFSASNIAVVKHWASLYCHRRGASPKLAGAFRTGTRTTASRCHAHCQDGLQVADRHRQSHLWSAQIHRRADNRHHQGGTRFSTVFLARP